MISLTPSPAKVTAPSHDEVVDAVLAASRALVAIAARSLAAAGVDVTLPQYRALVVLAYSEGETRTIDLASDLGVNSSTATRLVDRLIARKLVQRHTHSEDRRATSLQLTSKGYDVIGAVMAQRRADVRRLLRKVPVESRRELVDSLETLRAAAGESPEQIWTLGWSSDG